MKIIYKNHTTISAGRQPPSEEECDFTLNGKCVRFKKKRETEDCITINTEHGPKQVCAKDFSTEYV